MVSEKFRHQLRQEIEKWQAEGLIDRTLGDRLADRYGFSELESSARNRFITILLGLGSILVGLAVITLVAANWQVWSRQFKVALLMGLFVGINATGFYLWRSRDDCWRSRLGKGLLLLGALILGANLALMSQMFHQSGEVYQLYLIWGLGVLAMAHSLRLTFLGIVAVILTAIGYTLGIFDSWGWFSAVPRDPFSNFQFAFQHLPLLVSFLFIPLAYWCRSRWLFGLATLLIIYALEVNFPLFLDDFYNFSAISGGIMVAIACCLPPALLWAYRDSLWGAGDRGVSFNPITRYLAIFGLTLLFYLFSFHGFWEIPYYPSDRVEITGDDWVNLLDLLLLVGLTIWAWWRLGYEGENRSRWRLDRPSRSIAGAIVLSAFLIGANVSSDGWQTLPNDSWGILVSLFKAIGVLIFNGLLFALAIGLIRHSLTTGKRLGFWWGIIAIAVQVLSRMLEYNFGLFFKAIILLICGIGVIMAGLWFERYVRTFNAE